MILGREISIPPRKALKASSHRFASARCLTPGLTGSQAIPARELVKGHTLLFRDAPKAAWFPIRKPIRNCISKEV